MQRCADISRKYSDDDCFDEMKGRKSVHTGREIM